MLLYLLKNKSHVVSNDELTQNIWDYENIPSDATLRSHIRTLRELIGKEKKIKYGAMFKSVDFTKDYYKNIITNISISTKEKS
ncbi:MAG: helix-turn-helix domain-containing protein [Sulfurimonas sp.]|nr:helix-turn-helix domain-containing protein [Sulfurimonas sp.]